MVNILIANNDTTFSIKFINCISKLNSNIRICYIVSNVEKLLEILNNENDIDIILIDSKLAFKNKHFIINNLDDKNKYNDSFIVFSSPLNSPIIDVEKNKYIHSIVNNDINDLIQETNEFANIKAILKPSNLLTNKITSELVYLGYDISHKGTQYLMQSIIYVALNPYKDLDNLEKKVYPTIAKMYNDSTHNIKCRINVETTEMYFNCNTEKLMKYFNFSIDIKPKVKTVINTILRNVL